ncbi:hypothetical protein H2248_010419 [Termitomyces sp. 'cryptogamus']|nr:hypothetical protein H2248_010419 [Termitomyces sp. 'cryptogamus']
MSSSLSSVLRRPRSIIAILIVTVVLLTFFPWRNGWSSVRNFAQSWTPHDENRPSGVIFMLLPPSRVQQATLALRNVENRFNRRLKYPYLLFMVEGEYDEVTEVQKERIAHITQGRARFAEVPKSHWDTPDFLDKSLVEASRQKIGFSHGYRAMCRWYSGFFWNHPAFQPYEWLWRLDTDIEFHCDIPYDPIQRLIDNNALYGFVQIAIDAEWVQPTLASNVSAFMAEHRDEFLPDANQGFAWYSSEGVAKAMRGEAGNDEWTKQCMYNNFEISHRSVWNHPLYTRLFEFLDRAGGFFYERWSDSPVHSFGLSMTLRKDQVLQFKDMGYQHQGWAYSCPVESSSCTCIEEEKFENFTDGGELWFNA